ncbi:hypothetical protein LJC21_01690 [Bacteroides sp. OttesenSCG-928-E20]|nr:hypothetical protein [Bacteroides sp. OttesenSCG-928-N06]MDL2299402.1 hypothetical protein [Bacteroides sp. OttesenSCG-928-E20]MDL2304828.1 hypothetical protein [Bacteroides sp. OttesenSCG-928-D19]
MRIQLLLFIILLPVISKADDLGYGLYIKSYPYKTSEMSSLVLENGNPIRLDEEIKMSFDMYVRHDNVFGNVFRMKTDKDENIDLLFTVGEDDKRYPIFVINESVYPISKEIVREEWIPIDITLSTQRNTIKLKYGEEEEKTIPYQFKNSRSMRTAFGLCLFDGDQLTNVASVNIRDVRIFRNEKPFRHWKLEKHNHEICYDNIANIPAVTLNPHWLIDGHITWNKILSLPVEKSPSVAYNPDSDEFYIVSGSKEITVFDAKKQQRKEIKVNGGLYAANAPNQLIYIPEHRSLLSYNLDENIYSFFSFETNSWSSQKPNTKEHSYWNNSATFYPADLSLVSFGGYGFYRYNNELVKKYPFGNKVTDEKILLADISPRYNSSTAIVNNTLYIFGGRGNKSGRQELFPKNYYDFYSVNLQTRQVNKLWEITPMEGGDFMPSENLIYDAGKKCFYLFATQAGGKLIKISIDNDNVEDMSLSINEDFESQYLYINLYYSPNQKKLYALVNTTDVTDKAEINIYSLNYPPVPVSDLIQTPPAPEEQSSSSNTPYILIGILLAICLLGFVFLWYRKNKGNNIRKQDAPVGKIIIEEKDIEPTIENTGNTEAIESFETLPETYDFSKQSICFLGGFHARDKNGEDITTVFTPTLKVLLILLVLHTEEYSRGILGKKMLQLLWGDKTESSARNNRNVYLSKLRTVLEKIGQIEILSEGGFWSIKFGEDVTCDYVEAMNYLKNLKKEELLSEEEYYKLLELLLRGTLLPNTEIDWIDRFKSDFSNLTIDTLSSLLTEQENELSNNLKFRIAETLFQHDFINEAALHIKCKILSESGKMGLAKAFYDSYCKEYLNLLGTEYKHSLSDVIKKFPE